MKWIITTWKVGLFACVVGAVAVCQTLNPVPLKAGVCLVGFSALCFLIHTVIGVIREVLK